MNWKVRRDPFLGPLAARWGEDLAFQAGFFLDDDPQDAPLDDVDWLCTPPPPGVPGARPPVVLLSTGGFCPVHDGHLAMMETARQVVTEAGYDVLGGYLSPGHDAYLRLKRGSGAQPASARNLRCAEAAPAWIRVDPWESLHRRVSVNYTDVAARLRAYLRAQTDPRVEVIYVCGADNARFALAFQEQGGVVVVGRPGAEPERDRWRARFPAHPRIWWAEGAHPAASRRIDAPWSEPAGRVVLRLEGARGGPAGVDAPAFQRALVGLLARHLPVRTVPVVPADDPTPTISLDPMVPGTHNLAVSRLYALGGYQPLGHVSRPGSPPLQEQIAALPPGTYTLRDDDRVSGGTLAFVRAQLPPEVAISGEALAVAHDPDEDVLDSRDFLLGAPDGGLVVALPGGRLGRAPYVLPYVDPASRASLPSAQIRAFSVAVWELNMFSFSPTRLTVRDLPAPSRALFATWDPDTRLADLCAWHVARLSSLFDPAC